MIKYGLLCAFFMASTITFAKKSGKETAQPAAKLYEITDCRFKNTQYDRSGFSARIIHEDDSTGRHHLLRSQYYVWQPDNSYLTHTTSEQIERFLAYEKGRGLITFIAHHRLHNTIGAYPYKSNVCHETDSIYSAIVLFSDSLHKRYSDQTLQGRNQELQNWWNEWLVAEYNEIMRNGADQMLVRQTELKIPDGVKIKDPLQVNYTGIRPFLQYSVLQNAYHGSLADTDLYPIQRIDPINPDCDSSFCIENLDFTKNFELELKLKIPESAQNYEHGARIYIGSDDSSGGSTWFAIAPKYIKLTHCQGGNHKKDRRKSCYLYPKLKGVNSIAIRKYGSNYHLFVNGCMEKRIRFKALPGNDLLFGASLPDFQLMNIKMTYLP